MEDGQAEGKVSKACIENTKNKCTTDLESTLRSGRPFCRACSKLSDSSRKVKVL